MVLRDVLLVIFGMATVLLVGVVPGMPIGDRRLCLPACFVAVHGRISLSRPRWKRRRPCFGCDGYCFA